MRESPPTTGRVPVRGLCTFSIVAVDPHAEEVGVAVQSKFLAAGALVSWAQSHVGAVATQALAEVTYGPRGLELLATGLEPETVLRELLAADRLAHRRQIGVVAADGRAASHTGSGCQPEAMSLTGAGYAVQGNLLASESVVGSMAASFELTAKRPLAARLIEALRAGQRAGGDRRGQESAALLVAKPSAGYGGTHDRYIDLRVDNHTAPIEELARLYELHRIYFVRPGEQEFIIVDDQLEREIKGLLSKLGRLRPNKDLWEDLFDYMGWENLEERWGGPGRIDSVVLSHIRAAVRHGVT
jgi:uncharacterized Ntn-hydrolase superfamily protein